MMKTRLTYSFTPAFLSRFHRSNGALAGMYSNCVYSVLPSTRLCAQVSGANGSWLMVLLNSAYCASLTSFFGRAHRALAWLTVSQSPVLTMAPGWRPPFSSPGLINSPSFHFCFSICFGGRVGGGGRGGGVDGMDWEVGRGAAGPTHTLAGGKPGAARFHRDFVGHDEARIKADTKLADQLGILLLVARELAHEVLGAAFGDGAQMLYRLLLAHADAVVGDGQRAGGLVEAHTHFELGRIFKQRRLVQPGKAQLVAGIGRVGDQLAQEDFLVRVQRVGDQVQQLGHFGLKRQGLLAHGRVLYGVKQLSTKKAGTG